MNHTVNGISKTTDQWAKDLGVPQRAIDLELMRGKTLPDIVAALQTDTFSVAGRPPIARTHSAFVSTTIPPGAQRIFQLHGDCRECMARVRDIYDELHADHMKPAHPAPPPFLPGPGAPKDAPKATPNAPA